MRDITKKCVVIGIMLVEICFGFVLLKKTYFAVVEKEKVKGIAVVDKRLVERSLESNLKFFYKPKANEKIEDHPSWLDQKVFYTINSKGENERFEYETKKPIGTFRIVTIGDSHTFGHYVNTKDNYPEKLEDELNILNSNNFYCPKKNKVEVINLGVMGYDAEYTIHRFREDGERYSSDLIIWFLKNDDINEILEQILPRIKEVKTEILEKNPHFYDDPINIYNTRQQVKKEIKELLGVDAIIDYNRKLIENFIQDVKVPIIFLTYKSESEINNILTSYTELFLHIRVFSDLSLQEIDRLTDGHPSSLGYSHLAKKISNYLVDNQDWLCGN
ncbi:hypothetical protein ACFLZ1_04850 [Patescibacteria group bacterium]